MRKIIFLAVAALLYLGCSKQIIDQPPLKYSVMPRYLDLDSVGVTLPVGPSEVIDSSLTDFKSIPVFVGDTCTKGGILVSDRRYSEYIFYKSGYARQEVELKYSKYLMREYYDKAKSAEIVYQNEIVRLRKEAERTWLEKNLGYLGFIGGVLSAVLTEMAIISIAR
jgi:hypothetical protein